MTDLTGKVALVTGGSRGIGAAIAQRLARAGAAVAFTYVTAAGKAQAVAKQIDADGGRVLVIQADSSDPLPRLLINTPPIPVTFAIDFLLSLVS